MISAQPQSKPHIKLANWTTCQLPNWENIVHHVTEHANNGTRFSATPLLRDLLLGIRCWSHHRHWKQFSSGALLSERSHSKLLEQRRMVTNHYFSAVTHMTVHVFIPSLPLWAVLQGISFRLISYTSAPTREPRFRSSKQPQLSHRIKELELVPDNPRYYGFSEACHIVTFPKLSWAGERARPGHIPFGIRCRITMPSSEALEVGGHGSMQRATHT